MVLNSNDTILIVDDDLLILSDTARLLKKAGYNIIEAQTGEQALQFARKHIPDLILLANVLPDIGSLEICRSLKTNKNTSGIFICIVSGEKTKSSDLSDGPELGADEYIVLPIENRELLARVKAILRLKNVEKELEKHRSNLDALVKERTAELQHEIAKRKLTENALRESEIRFRTLTDQSPNMVFINHKGRVVYVNDQCHEMMGYKKDEFYSPEFDFLSLITSDSLAQTESSFKKHLSNIEVPPLEYTIVKKDGNQINTIISTKLIDYKGERAILGVVTCITEQKRIERELKESQERYLLATHAGKVGVWDWDLSTGKMFISPNLNAMLGYDDHEIKNHIGDWGKHVFADDVEFVMNEANACIDGTKKDYQVEHRMVHKDGSIRWFLASGKVERDETGRAIRFFGTDTDITDMKVLEEKLRKSQKMEALGTLAGGIAHECNNILGIIIGNTELALDDVPEWNPARDLLEEIRAASLRGKDIVRQIMSFARKSPTMRKPIKISTIIKESLKLIRATIPTSIEIHQEILCDSEMIFANPTEINQIVMNLYSNSVHAMEEESGVLEVRLEKVILNDRSAAKYENLTAGEYVKLTVKDTGKGIDPEIIDRIFDPYFTTKDIENGLGMGLAVVFGIVKKHDGAIKFMSEVGKGTTAEVLLPIAKVEIEIEMEKTDDLPTGTERILCVDDEASLIKMVKQMLERQGYEVVGKTSSTEALKLFQEESDKIDLIITDMAMPEMAGDRLAQELIKIRPNIPIILYTGHSDRIDEDTAKKLGIKAYRMKPLTKTDLVKTVRKVLDEAKNSIS